VGGLGEEIFLAPLEAICSGGLTQAEHWLSRYDTEWHGDVTRIFAEAAV
jgi:glutamate--cysteine ligase